MEQKQILIVEDEVLIAEFLSDILRKGGWKKITIAHKFNEARNLLEQCVYDLVLFDIRMDGEFSGVELATSLSEKDQTPFIFITANSDLEVMQKALCTGPAAFLTKPFRSADLLAAIELAFQVASKKRPYPEEIVSTDEASDFGGLIFNGEVLTTKTLSQYDIDRIRAVHDCCENNYWNNEFNAEDIAEELKVSRRQLYRYMSDTLQTTPAQFLKKFRLQKAYSFILGGKYQRVKSVAYEVGFLKVVYFSQEFEKEFGVKPSELLKAVRQA